MKKRRRSYSREKLLAKIKFLQAVEDATWNILLTEVSAGPEKERLGHWLRGFNYALGELRKLA